MTSRPRHLFISHDFLPNTGGVATFYERVADSLIQRYDLTVLTVPTDASIPQAPYTVIRRAFFFRTLRPRWLKLFPLLFSVIRKVKPDVIHVGHVLPTGTVAFLLTRVFCIPYVVYIHGMDITIPLRYRRKKWIMQMILSNAQSLVATNHFVLDVCKRHFTALPTLARVLPLPQIPQTFPVVEDRQKLRERYRLPSNAFVLLTVGRLVKRKGFSDTLKAVASLRTRYPNLRYVIVGSGPEDEQIQKSIHALNLHEVVTLTGFVEASELAVWYATADLFVMPAFNDHGDVEGFGIVFLEAAAYGVPSIGTHSGGISEAIEDGKTGFLVAEHDVAMLTRRIDDFLTHPEKREQFSHAAQKRVTQTLNWKHEEEQLYQCLP